MLFYILLSALVALLVYFHISIRYSRQGRMLSKIPGPFSFPIIGSLHLFTDRSQRGLWITIRMITDTWYPICKGWAMGLPLLSVRHPDDLEVILSSQKACYKKFPYKYLRSWLNDGLLTNKGDTYRARRRMLTSAFHFNMLRRYVDIMNEQSGRLMTELRANGKEIVLDVLPIYADVSLNIIIGFLQFNWYHLTSVRQIVIKKEYSYFNTESAMGIDLDKTDKKVIKDYKEAIEDMGTVLIYRMLRPYILDWMMTPFTEIGRKQIHALKVLREFTDKIIKERRKYHEMLGGIKGYKEFTDSLENQDESESIYAIGHKKKLPMLDILLSAEKDGLLDEKGIKEEVDTFLLGGTDTTRMVMAYFTMLMAENKECQDKARAEVCELLERSGGKTGMTELSQMPYLEQCIKESMRLYPIASTIFRHTVDDIQLKNYTIPAGVVVICHIIDAHRDPNFWTEPEKFDPDRFLPENCRHRHSFAYLPFSAGPRNCIGQKFGWMEVKAVCSRLLYNFYLEPIDSTRDMQLIGDFVLRPADPFHTKFIRIDRE
ncbi:hypothetical protein TSAR_008029 [Trichomalopsis sarcophagae]|uniref:Cytochrome P450 n=1 Tax=Trichomalopsis sarcophagae TaxID=543379 RepID=A0A232EW57_9HYME|nr:hypothetical protein TSAR_008029 [Trichomalopsis sarcophagae]